MVVNDLDDGDCHDAIRIDSAVGASGDRVIGALEDETVRLDYRERELFISAT